MQHFNVMSAYEAWTFSRIIKIKIKSETMVFKMFVSVNQIMKYIGWQ